MDKNIDVCLYDWEYWVHTHTLSLSHTLWHIQTHRQRIVKKRKEIFVRDFHKEPLSKAGKRVLLCYCNILLYLYWLFTQEAIEKKEVRGEKRETILPNIYESFQTMCVCLCMCVRVCAWVCLRMGACVSVGMSVWDCVWMIVNECMCVCVN